MNLPFSIIRLGKMVLPVLFFILGQTSFATHPITTVGAQDSLIIIKQSNGKEKYIRPGKIIKIYQEGEKTIRGKLVAYKDGVIITENDDSMTHTKIYNIDKIEVNRHPIWQILGFILLILGIGSFVFTIIILAAGLIALANDDLGAIVLFSAPFLALGGLVGTWIGNLLRSRKFKMNKHWKFKKFTPQEGKS